MCIALSIKILHITDVSCRLYLTAQLPKIPRGWEAEGLEKEAKVCFILLIPCFSSSSPPS
jgi:hypothetical protein